VTIKRMLARIRKYYRTMKGPPPKVHGVIPDDPEQEYIDFDYPYAANQEWLNGQLPDKRRYLHDPSLMLRPGRAYRPLAKTDPEEAFWRAFPLEDNRHD